MFFNHLIRNKELVSEDLDRLDERVRVLYEEMKSFRNRTNQFMKEPWYSSWKGMVVPSSSQWNRMSVDERNAWVKECNETKRC